MSRIACFFGAHPMYVGDNVDLRWNRKSCAECGMVLVVQDAYTGARYSGPDQIADNHFRDFPNASDAAYLFARLSAPPEEAK